MIPLPDRREVLAVFLGGTAGASARVALTVAGGTSAPGWPWVTFAVNVLGAVLLGYAATRLGERLPPSAYRRPLLGTGFCGGFTTFSTMQLEVLEMLDAGLVGRAVAYLAASIAAGCLGVHLATAGVRRVRRIA